MNIPNILTAIRFALIPFFGYYLFSKQFLIAIILFAIAGITDVLDGFIARKFNMITPWGKIADPLADKLMQLTALTILTIHHIIPLPILIIVLSKEIFMLIGSILLYKKIKLVVQANWYGKLATVIFFIAIILTIAVKTGRFGNMNTGFLINTLVIIAVLSTLFAFSCIQ